MRIYRVHPPASLEHHLEPKLNHPRSTAAQAGIGLSDVGGLGDTAQGQQLSLGVISGGVWAAISQQAWCQIVIGQREVRMIENVEKLRPKLQVEPFPDLCILGN